MLDRLVGTACCQVGVSEDDLTFGPGDESGVAAGTAPHLLREKIGRKLLAIEPPTDTSQRLSVCFVSEGRYSSDVNQIEKDGYTVWGMKPDGTLRAVFVDSIDAAARAALRIE